MSEIHNSPLASIAVYFQTSDLPINTSLKYLSSETKFLTNPTLLFKVRENFDLLRKDLGVLFRAVFLKSQVDRYITDVKAFDADWFFQKIPEVDSKRIMYLLLQNCENLRKTIDWDSFERYAGDKERDYTDNLMFVMRRLTKKMASIDVSAFLRNPDVTAYNLDYYRAHDLTGTKARQEKVVFFSHIFTLRQIYEEAVDVIHNASSSEDISSFKNRISKSIQFPPQYYRAGMAIISEFQKILRQRYRDLDVKFSIEQDGLIVRLVIDAPDGQRTVIEQALDQYLGAVSGAIDLKDYARDPLEEIDLRHFTDMLQLTVKHQQNLLEFAGNRVRFLEGQLANSDNKEQKLIGHIGDLIEQKRDDAKEWRTVILAHLENSAGELRSSLLYLQEAVEQNQSLTDDNLRIALEIIRKQRPGFFEEINNFLVNAAVSGAVGNAFYDWLSALMKSLPR